MEIKLGKNKITEFLKKYRYVFFVLLIGIALMLLPDLSADGGNVSSIPNHEVQESQSLESRL